MAAVLLEHDARAAELRRDEVAEIAPVGLRIERPVDVHDRGILAQDRGRERERADGEPRRALRGRLGAAFAADLVVHQAVAGLQRGIEEQVHVRGNAADGLQSGTEDEDDGEGGIHAK